ncbi:thioredoxin domain-containing protein [Acidithrix sp. C25]|uniref:thioredoxin domain-containing protein n=1 Tax=Acidithrix sp. C25 TaxID=1671482 RepID=UPI00191BAE47|nr:thioredoxin domain-containing protein [Acidithrix sp. C25]CAG4905530.1 unnamed protein product [Acidithrix sp. C25]
MVLYDPIQINDEVTLNEMIEGYLKQTLLIGLVTQWSSSSKVVLSTLEELVRTSPDEIVILIVDVDHNDWARKRFSVDSVPMVIRMREGQVAAVSLRSLPIRSLAAQLRL